MCCMVPAGTVVCYDSFASPSSSAVANPARSISRKECKKECKKVVPKIILIYHHDSTLYTGVNPTVRIHALAYGWRFNRTQVRTCVRLSNLHMLIRKPYASAHLRSFF